MQSYYIGVKWELVFYREFLYLHYLPDLVIRMTLSHERKNILRSLICQLQNYRKAADLSAEKYNEIMATFPMRNNFSLNGEDVFLSEAFPFMQAEHLLGAMGLSGVWLVQGLLCP